MCSPIASSTVGPGLRTASAIRPASSACPPTASISSRATRASRSSSYVSDVWRPVSGSRQSAATELVPSLRRRSRGGPDTRRPPPVASGVAALMSPDLREREHRTVEVAGIEPVGRCRDVLARAVDLRERCGHLRSRRLRLAGCVDGVNARPARDGSRPRGARRRARSRHVRSRGHPQRGSA